mmetsp:Transcript_89252/g.239225  ORF Transcript_89252/g.239225 Transcript_89252/m.239225 type:complete len:249 (-) Transcript_89252:98-844(-)
MSVVFSMFAVFFTDGVTGHVAVHGFDADLIFYFGGVGTTLSTLFLAITGGLDWYRPCHVLARVSWLYVVAFYIFIAFSLFVMLNVVSAIFIDSTLQRSKNDRDFVVHQEMSGRQEFMRKMEVIFDELDPENHGKISLRQFQSYIGDPKKNAYFRGIDLNVFKIKKLFRLMDTDRSGEVSRDEFIQGCNRLKGEAKELDLAILQGEVNRVSMDIGGISKLICRLGEHIDDSLIGLGSGASALSRFSKDS